MIHRLALALMAAVWLAAPLAAEEGTIDGLNKGVLRIRAGGTLHRVEIRSIKVLDATGKTLDNRGVLANAKRGARVDVKIVDGKMVELRFLESAPAPMPTQPQASKEAASPPKVARPKEDRPAKNVQLPKDVSQADLQRALDDAQSGDIITLAAGTTVITEPLVFQSGVSLVGPADGHAVLDASAVREPVIIAFAQLDEIVLRRLDLRNIGLHFPPNPECDSFRKNPHFPGTFDVLRDEFRKSLL